MPFKYVLVPASPNEEMKEMTFEKPVSLEKDEFRTSCENYFASAGATVDKGMLLAQLNERTGKKLEQEMDADMLDKVMGVASVEIFPIMLPTKAFGFHCVSAYCDDKGVSKDLEINVRVSGLVQACGYPGQQFRGDVFLGRVFDDEDAWERVDFTMADCNSDADWVQLTKNQRSKKNVNDMNTAAEKFGLDKNNTAKLTPDTMDMDMKPAGETEAYTWRQTGEDVEITFKKEGLTKADAKQVKVEIKKQKIKVDVKGEILLQGNFPHATDPDCSTWTLSDGILQVTLAKSDDNGPPETWDSLIKA